jgi:hypothetical protein
MASTKRGATGELLQWVLIAAVVMIPASLPLYVVYSSVVIEQRQIDHWKITGPPCTEVAHVSVLAAPPKRGPMSVNYAGAKLSRSYGSIFCAEIPEGRFTRAVYHVCQFDNPGAVTVKLGARSRIFEPPVGRRATITLKRGQVSCVVGGWFSD